LPHRGTHSTLGSLAFSALLRLRYLPRLTRLGTTPESVPESPELGLNRPRDNRARGAHPSTRHLRRARLHRHPRLPRPLPRSPHLAAAQPRPDHGRARDQTATRPALARTARALRPLRPADPVRQRRAPSRRRRPEQRRAREPRARTRRLQPTRPGDAQAIGSGAVGLRCDHAPDGRGQADSGRAGRIESPRCGGEDHRLGSRRRRRRQQQHHRGCRPAQRDNPARAG
jgi:putative component of toxin-antitoxin plasmid stabilization module